MDFSDKVTVFTYGTLMKGFPNERVISAFPHENYKAFVKDMLLYDVGAFPAMVKGDSVVEGELVVFDVSVNKKALFMNMDILEGYNEHDPVNSLYWREPVTVYVDNEPVETEVYLWNMSCDRLKPIDLTKYSGYRAYMERS